MKAATAKYLKQLRKVLKSQLNTKYKVQAHNSYVLSVTGYSAEVVSCPKEEMKATDDTTRNILTMHGVFHSKCSIHRLFS